MIESKEFGRYKPSALDKRKSLQSAEGLNLAGHGENKIRSILSRVGGVQERARSREVEYTKQRTDSARRCVGEKIASETRHQGPTSKPTADQEKGRLVGPKL